MTNWSWTFFTSIDSWNGKEAKVSLPKQDMQLLNHKRDVNNFLFTGYIKETC